MVRNYFYLIVGILCVLFAITHTLNGITTALPLIDNTNLESSTKVVFTYIWHIIGIENLVIGMALLIMAFVKESSKVKFTAWLIIAILTMRWIVITFFSLINNYHSVKQLIPDTIAIFIVILLLFLGTKNGRNNRQQLTCKKES